MEETAMRCIVHWENPGKGAGKHGRFFPIWVDRRPIVVVQCRSDHRVLSGPPIPGVRTNLSGGERAGPSTRFPARLFKIGFHEWETKLFWPIFPGFFEAFGKSRHGRFPQMFGRDALFVAFPAGVCHGKFSIRGQTRTFRIKPWH